VQTFLPYPSFSESATALDYRRLGKQRVEAKQILNALEGKTKGWVRHPAVRMWRGYENALKVYYNTVLLEWILRGYRNNMEFEQIVGDVVLPPWFGDDAFHASHRSNLLKKDPVWYGQFGWKEPDDLPYLWPEEVSARCH
jgi:hypothetical protein